MAPTGTFHASDEVLFASIHQWPLFPGTGPASDVGSGAGEGYTVNLPVPPGTGDAAYRSLVDHVVCPLIGAWEPQLVLVSAGFDAHVLDPLADCRVSEYGYAAMTASLRRACDAVGAPLGLVLEGGYSLKVRLGRGARAAADRPDRPGGHRDRSRGPPDRPPGARATRALLARAR